MNLGYQIARLPIPGGRFQRVTLGKRCAGFIKQLGKNNYIGGEGRRHDRANRLWIIDTPYQQQFGRLARVNGRF